MSKLVKCKTCGKEIAKGGAGGRGTWEITRRTLQEIMKETMMMISLTAP